MPISYDKLWKLLIDKKMNRTDLKDAAGISFPYPQMDVNFKRVKEDKAA